LPLFIRIDAIGLEKESPKTQRAVRAGSSSFLHEGLAQGLHFLSTHERIGRQENHTRRTTLDGAHGFAFPRCSKAQKNRVSSDRQSERDGDESGFGAQGAEGDPKPQMFNQSWPKNKARLLDCRHFKKPTPIDSSAVMPILPR
jgi:hypothetical protein